MSVSYTGKPEWLRVPVWPGPGRDEVEASLARLKLHTVCEEAACPNLCECFSKRTATFMILGNACTRRCTFCAVSKGAPTPVDSDEPNRLAEAAAGLNLRHVVITSVTRDDLADGGAAHFAACVRAIREKLPGATVEILTPDFQGRHESLAAVVAASPDVLNHNVETVPRLYPAVRPIAEYGRSVGFLREAKRLDPGIVTKSGIMLGLGETVNEVYEVMKDLAAAGVSLLTIGQYLPPSGAHYPLVEYVRPEIFESLKDTGLRMGFTHVASGPLVRSSYEAGAALASDAVRSADAVPAGSTVACARALNK